jgi:predicted dehydrogenase
MKLFYVGIIGYGKMGKIYADEIKKNRGYKIIDIFNYNKLGNKPHLVKKFFYSKKTNLLVISSPINTHFKYLKYAYKSEKNIIVEKPLVENSYQLKKLLQLNKNFKKKIMIHHNDVLNLEKLKFLKKNNINKLKKIEMFYGTKNMKNSYKKPLLDWLPHPLAVIVKFFNKRLQFKILEYSTQIKKNLIYIKIILFFKSNNIPIFVNFSNDLNKATKKIIFYTKNKQFIYDGYMNKNKRTIKLLLEKFCKYKIINDLDLNFRVYKFLFQIISKLSR